MKRASFFKIAAQKYGVALYATPYSIFQQLAKNTPFPSKLFLFTQYYGESFGIICSLGYYFA